MGMFSDTPEWGWRTLSIYVKRRLGCDVESTPTFVNPWVLACRLLASSGYVPKSMGDRRFVISVNGHRSDSFFTDDFSEFGYKALSHTLFLIRGVGVEESSLVSMVATYLSSGGS